MSLNHNLMTLVSINVIDGKPKPKENYSFELAINICGEIRQVLFWKDTCITLYLIVFHIAVHGKLVPRKERVLKQSKGMFIVVLSIYS